METGPWPHLDRRQERGVVWGGRHRSLLEVPANFLELRKGEVRILGILRSSLPASNAQATPKIAHLSDTSAPIRQYATPVTDKGTPRVRPHYTPHHAPQPEGGSSYETHRSVVGHHDSDRVGGERGCP